MIEEKTEVTNSDTRRRAREAKAIAVIKAMRPEPTEPFVPTFTRRELELVELLDAPSHIYFIYSGGLVKIGFSTNWRKRVESVCQGCPEHAEMIMVMTGDRQMEAGYHALFGEYRVRGEWFRCEGKMREFLHRFTTPEGRENLELAEASFAEEA